MADSDITIEVLKDIRGELRQFRAETSQRLDRVDQRLEVLDERLDLTNQRLEIGNRRLDVVESTLLTVARRQRSLIRLVRVGVDNHVRVAERVNDLEARVGKLEAR